MWIELVVGGAALLAITLRWNATRPAERLLVLWVVVGLAELIIHDSGNERRYVMFIPAFIALASLAIASRTPLVPSATPGSGRMAERVWSLGILLVLTYLAAGSLARPLLLGQIEAGHLHTAVRLAAATAVLVTGAAAWRWTAVVSFVRGRSMPALVGGACLVAAAGWNAIEFTGFAARHTEENYAASVALGRLLPAGTLVQGKLANGLALENRIRPLFVGNGFGNYADRLHRDDVRYILTYDLPRLGYESSDGSGLIQGILDQYPHRRVIAAFDVDETPGADRAVLIDKFPDGAPLHARD
jgi:hypothetical protein